MFWGTNYNEISKMANILSLMFPILVKLVLIDSLSQTEKNDTYLNSS